MVPRTASDLRSHSFVHGLSQGSYGTSRDRRRSRGYRAYVAALPRGFAPGKFRRDSAATGRSACACTPCGWLGHGLGPNFRHAWSRYSPRGWMFRLSVWSQPDSVRLRGTCESGEGGATTLTPSTRHRPLPVAPIAVVHYDHRGERARDLARRHGRVLCLRGKA